MKKALLFICALLGLAGTAKADVEWTIWEGSMNASEGGAAGEWKQSLYLNNNNFADLAVGDVIYLTLTKNDGVEGDAQVAIYKQLYVKDGDTESWPESEFGGGLTTYNDVAGDFSFKVTSDILAVFQTEGFINLRLAGRDFTLTKVAIKKHFSAIKTTLSSDAKSFGDWKVGYWSSKESLANVAAGDFFYLPATRQTTYTEGEDVKDVTWWAAYLGDGDENSDTWKYDINSFNHDNWKKIEAADVENIKAHAIWVSGAYYNCTGLYTYHPVSSFSIGSIGMATFCANVAVSVPEGIEAYTATVSGSSVVLTKIADGVIPANTGVIIKGDEGAVVEFAATTTDNTYDSNVLTGTTAATTMTAGDYVLYNNEGQAEFRRVTATELAANKAYLPAAKIASGAPALNIVFGNETTGISAATAAAKANNRIYNLNGQEMKAAKSGLYIKNGKKFFAK